MLDFFTYEELETVLDINPEVKTIFKEEIISKINLLKQLGYLDEEIKEIIILNPFFLTNDYNDIKNLLLKLQELGFDNLDEIFIKNPFLLNKHAFEIDMYINKCLNNGYLKEEIITTLKNNPDLIDEE